MSASRFRCGVWLVGALLLGNGAAAQREFVEELEPSKRINLDEVDLDAPDPGAAPKPAVPRPAVSPPAVSPPAVSPPAVSPPAVSPLDLAKPAAPVKPLDPGKSATSGKTATPAKPADPAMPSDPAAVDPATGATTPAAEPGAVRVLETTFAALLEKWDVRAARARKGDHTRAQLTEVREALKDFGVQGVPGAFHASGAAAVLLNESKTVVDEGNIEEAQGVVDAAELAAPDTPAFQSLQARIKWSTGDIGGMVNALIAAAKLYQYDPLAVSQLAARSLAVVWLAAFVVLALLALCVGLPALRYTCFDIVRVLPKGAARGQIWLLLAMLGLAPLVIGGGPLLCAYWLLTLAWLHLPGRALGTALVVGAILASTPLGLDLASRWYSYAGSRADDAHRALYDVSGEPQRLRLSARPADSLDLWEQAALAYQAKREGRLGEAKTRLAALVEQHPGAAFARAELGVVHALLGDHEAAVADLAKASSADPRLVAAIFNTSVLQFRVGNTEKAEAAARSLPESARAVVESFRAATFRAPDAPIGHNRAFVDVYPPPLDVMRAGMEDPQLGRPLEASLARALTLGETGRRALLLLGAFPIFWLVLLAAKKRIAPAQACARCGSPASGRVDGKDVPADSCGQCFHAFVSTRSRIDAAVKLHKERQILLRGQRRSRTTRVASLLLPGAGHIVAGAPVRGALLSFSWTACAGAMWFASGRMPMPRLDGPWGDTPGMVVVAIAAGVIWLVAQVSAWGLADSPAARGRGR